MQYSTVSSILKDYSPTSLEKRCEFRKENWGYRAVRVIDGSGRGVRNTLGATIDRIIGLILAPISLIGWNEPTLISRDTVCYHLVESKYLVPDIFKEIITVLNPSTKIGKVEPFSEVCSVWYIDNIHPNEQKDPLDLTRRISALLCGTSALVGATIDAIASVIFVTTALITLGSFDSVNGRAYISLGCFNLDIEAYETLSEFIHPSWE